MSAVTHVALLAESLDPARGGAERAIRAVARALVRQGVSVALVAPRDRLGPEEPGTWVLGVAPNTRSRPARARALAAELMPIARRAVPQARIVATGKITGAHALWSHAGVHAVAREAAANAGRGPVHAALARVARRLRPVESVFDEIEAENVRAALEGGLRVLALSERVRADYARVHALDPARIVVVRNGVERERFELSREQWTSARTELESRARLQPGETLALFVAHAFALKGLDRAIAALAHAPRARLLVIGRGRRAAFERVAHRRGVAERVVFAGAVEGLERLLGAADVLVHPSRFDPCSLVVLEALAAGVPVIASPADGSSELVRPGAGFVLADPDDTRELGGRLRELEDPLFRAGASEAARASARTTDEVARELLVNL